jgi:hypothetical protein
MNFSLFCCLILVLFSRGYLEGRSPSSTRSGSGAEAQGQSHTPDPNQETKKQNKKEKGAADDLGRATSFSDAVAEDVLHVLADGLQGHNEGRMLSVFDGSAMDGYLNFSDQVSAMFQQYDSFRVHYNIDQTTTDGTKGVALVDFEMEEAAASANVQPVYKHEQVRFEMERGKKAWKIVNVKPRAFFS